MCECINHWEHDCPANTNRNPDPPETTLFPWVLHTQKTLERLPERTLSAAVLDLGSVKLCAGKLGLPLSRNIIQRRAMQPEERSKQYSFIVRTWLKGFFTCEGIYSS